MQANSRRLLLGLWLLHIRRPKAASPSHPNPIGVVLPLQQVLVKLPVVERNSFSLGAQDEAQHAIEDFFAIGREQMLEAPAYRADALGQIELHSFIVAEQVAAKIAQVLCCLA